MRKIFFPTKLLSVLLVFAILICSLPVATSHSTVLATNGGSLRGDVTADGVVDGRDALKVMRFVEGLDSPTAQDIVLGDVYPVPGTEGRIVGDGRLTREDANEILRSAVGLIPAGQVTGDFASSPPQISDFTPAYGPAGTQVTINGQNFVAVVQENIVSFGDVTATVIQASGTRLVAQVPPNAESGPITVVTPGGLGRSPGDFQVVVEQAGQLQLPAGLNPLQFDIISPYGQNAANTSGGFTVPTNLIGPTVVGAAPKSGDGENIFLNVFDPPPSPVRARTSPQGVDSLSTAKTLIWMQPHFITDNPVRKAELWALMDTVSEVAALAALIGQKYPTNQHPFEDTALDAALTAAITAVFNALPETYKVSLPQESTQGSTTRAETTKARVIPADTNIILTQEVLEAINLNSRLGNPLDWFVWLHQLNPNDFPTGIKPYDATAQTYPRSGYTTQTLVPAQLLSAKLAVASELAKLLTGLIKPENQLVLTTDDDALYIMRAYSGSLRDTSPGKIDSALLKKLNALDGTLPLTSCNKKAFDALAINLIIAAVDAASIFVPAEEYTELLVKGGLVFFARSYPQQFPTEVDPSTLSNYEITRRIWIVFTDTLTGVIQAAITALDKTPWQKKLFSLFGKVCKPIAFLNKVSAVGRAAERTAGLFGTSAGSLVGLDSSPTPVESAFVIKGDPFGPKITSFSPASGGAGTEVTINGSRFAPVLADNQVSFGGWAVKMISATTTQIKVQLFQSMTPGKFPISVKTPMGGPSSSESNFEVLRTPYIISLSPDNGYAKVTFTPDILFKGTKVFIQGEWFDKSKGDQVTFDDIPAEIDDSESRLAVWVPASLAGRSALTRSRFGATGTTVQVRVVAGDTGLKSSPYPFILVGPPTLESAFPGAPKGGDTITISGSNFSPATNMTWVRFEYDGTTRYERPATVGWSHLTVYMPTYIPEGTEVQVKVETPAGVSAGKTLTRAPGLKAGGTVTVNTTSADDKPDGQLSLPEAVRIVTGKLDPYPLPGMTRTRSPAPTTMKGMNLKLATTGSRGTP